MCKEFLLHKSAKSPTIFQRSSSDKNKIKTMSSSSTTKVDEINELAEKVFRDSEDESQKGNQNASEEVIIRIPDAILHLIDENQSLELANGEFSVIQLKQGGNVVAAFARVADKVQWPLAKDEAAVKLDDCHYFFSLRVPGETNSDGILNYGLTIPAEEKLDSVLAKFSGFSVEEVAAAGEEQQWWGPVAKGVSSEEVEKSAAAYWTTLAPNVEEYSGSLAKMIAAGSGQVVKRILWCGDVTVERLKRGEHFLHKRLGKCSNRKISSKTIKRMKRVKKMTKMSEKVAKAVLSEVVKVSGFFTTSAAKSEVGQKFFSLLPGEIVLASLDGFIKIYEAIEVAGKNVMSTSVVVTTGLVSQKYGEEAGEVTREGVGAAGHAIATAWTVFKIRTALTPKGLAKPTILAKVAAHAKAFKAAAQAAKTAKSNST